MAGLERSARRLDELNRRQFLARMAKLSLGVSFGLGCGQQLAAAVYSDPVAGLVRRPTARNVIYLFMSGGMSHLDTFDTKPDLAEVQGPVRSIATRADGVRVSQYLPLLAQQMGHVAVINSMTSNQGAHEPGQYFMHTSYQQRGTIRHPAMGAWIMELSGRSNTTLPGNVVISGGSNHPGAGYMEARFAPLSMGKPEAGLEHSSLPKGVDDERFDRRRELADRLNKRFEEQFDQRQVRAYRDLYDEAVHLMRSRDLAAFDLGAEDERIRASYGTGNFGQGCLLARRLVEHDVRFVEVNLGGWDTHNDNFDRVEEKCQELDRALAALLADLNRRGLLSETLVVLATEFGRTPRITDDMGRDHHPAAFSCLLAGGGINGGQIYGQSDERGGLVADKPVTIPDFNATIAYALGLPIEKVIHSSTGRPFTVAHKGKPLTALF